MFTIIVTHRQNKAVTAYSKGLFETFTECREARKRYVSSMENEYLRYNLKYQVSDIASGKGSSFRCADGEWQFIESQIRD